MRARALIYPVCKIECVLCMVLHPLPRRHLGQGQGGGAPYENADRRLVEVMYTYRLYRRHTQTFRDYARRNKRETRSTSRRGARLRVFNLQTPLHTCAACRLGKIWG